MEDRMHECTCADNKIDLTVLDPILDAHKDNPGALIRVLQETQAALGYLPTEAIREVARRRGTPLSTVWGVATFYGQFRLKPQGKTVFRVCTGTACHVAGASQITNVLEETLGISAGETTEDLSATLETVACLGCCSLAPVVMVGEQTYGRLDPAATRKLVKKHVRSGS
jgi:NADH-quinone oxidoreductase subunit E